MIEPEAANYNHKLQVGRQGIGRSEDQIFPSCFMQPTAVGWLLKARVTAGSRTTTSVWNQRVALRDVPQSPIIGPVPTSWKRSKMSSRPPPALIFGVRSESARGHSGLAIERRQK